MLQGAGLLELAKDRGELGLWVPCCLRVDFQLRDGRMRRQLEFELAEDLCVMGGWGAR